MVSLPLNYPTIFRELAWPNTFVSTMEYVFGYTFCPEILWESIEARPMQIDHELKFFFILTKLTWADT